MKSVNVHRILVPVDFSPAGTCALQQGIYLANKFRADIFLLHVLEGIFAYPNEWFDQSVRAPGKEQLKKIITEKLSEISEDITKKHGVYVESLITIGKPALQIIETVNERDIDLIVMGSHGTEGFEEVFVGSTAHKVVNLSPCPVITVREGVKSEGFKIIVLPIDNSRYSRQKVSNVLPLATKCNSAVHVLGIIQGEDKSDIAKLNIKLNTVQEAIENAGLVYVRKIINGKNIAIEAIKYAEEVNADLVSIMTDHESNLTGMFMGAFARQIVNHSKVPIMSIKPMEGPYESAS
jgi:nucleotide-binding universal stress UspA family protein